MPGYFQSFRTLLPASLLPLLAASPAHAATYSGPVNKADWGTNVPSHMDMYIAVPDVMPDNPPILVNIHSCGNNAGGQWSYDGFAPLRTAMDSVGFIMILPQQSRNCWDVGTPEALTHNGGKDTLAIVQMVQYALQEYNGDPTRVYVMGGSGGGMMTQALLAVYPEVFKAGHARAGVPAGCWAEGYLDQPDQWSGQCAGGSVDKTAQQWGDLVRAMNPDYSGPRPRVQLNHGNNDETISFNNFREAIEEWTNVLGLAETPTSTDTNFQGSAATYDRQFWEDDCGYVVLEAWEALGQGHSMGYEAVHILEWFGLDQVREQDPWDAACGNPGSTGGTGGVGGAGSQGGSGGTGNEGGTTADGGTSSSAGQPSTGASTCVPGVDTGDSCNPAVDTEPCVRPTRECVCGSTSTWACSQTNEGSGGTGGAGGAATSGGAANVTGGTSSSGGSPAGGGRTGSAGNTSAVGGAQGTGGVQSTGGVPATTGNTGTGGVVTGGQGNALVGVGGGAVTGGTGGGQASPVPTPVGGSSTGGQGTGGATAPQLSSSDEGSGDDGGCGCRVGGAPGQRGALGLALALLTGIMLNARRWRTRQPERAD